MEQIRISYKDSTIAVSVFGSGRKPLFCFHGFGENGKTFTVFENELGKEFKLIAIDLPFHGDTTWNGGLLFTASDILHIIDAILQQTGFDNKFSIAGYSLGGRVALQLLEIIPGRIERVVLLAPDGLRLNFWYWLGTQTYVGNKLFAFTMKNPGWFFAMVNISGRVGILNKSITKFVHYYLDDALARKELYERWTTMRKFKPNLETVQANIQHYLIPVRFVFGAFDRIILDKRSENFKRDTKNVKIVVMEAGHQLLKEKYAAQIAQLFFD